MHSANVLAGKNAISLSLNPVGKRLEIVVGTNQLHQTADVCTSLVVATNNALFKEMAKRWAVDWPKMPGWDDDAKFRVFKQLWGAFFSLTDEKNGEIQDSMTTVKCKNSVLATFS